MCAFHFCPYQSRNVAWKQSILKSEVHSCWRHSAAQQLMLLARQWNTTNSHTASRATKWLRTSHVGQPCNIVWRRIAQTAQCATQKYFNNVVALKQQWSEPGLAGNLYYCLAVALACLALFPFIYFYLTTILQQALAWLMQLCCDLVVSHRAFEKAFAEVSNSMHNEKV